MTGHFTVTFMVSFFPLPSLAVAVIVTVPFFMPQTFPFESTVATFVLLLFQVTSLISAFVGWTVAVRVNVFFTFTVLALHLIVTPVTIFLTTVTLQAAFFPLPSAAVAVIVAVPFPMALTFPLESTVATFVLLLVHITFLISAFVGLTVTDRVCVFPTCIVRLLLFSVTLDTDFFGVTTVTVQVAFSPLPSAAVALIIAVPFPLAVTFPLELTVATALLLVVHFTVLLSASEGLTVAVSFSVFLG